MKTGIFSLVVISLCASAPLRETRAEPDFDIDTFLVKHCFECHDDLVQKGDRRLNRIARCLLEKMLTDATGRHLTFADEAEVMRLDREWKEAGHGIRDLVRLVAGSVLLAKK
jgi:hypothetical protein